MGYVEVLMKQNGSYSVSKSRCEDFSSCGLRLKGILFDVFAIYFYLLWAE